MRPLIEICLESASSVLNAAEGGADRVELCSDLFEGGLTASAGTLRVARRLTDIPINVMIRPRGGDFCYSDTEFEIMKEDVHILKEEGASGIVFGILSPDGTIDLERSDALIALARPLPVTFHRAFDMTKDPYQALEDLISLSVDRLLTSGQEATVAEGADLLADLVKRAGEQIVIMPGCGITERNMEKLHSKIQAKEYHVFLPHEMRSRMEFHPEHIYMGGLLRQSEFTLCETSRERVSALKGLLS